MAAARSVKGKRRGLVAADFVAAAALLAAIVLVGGRRSEDQPTAPVERPTEIHTQRSAVTPSLGAKALPDVDDCRKRGITLRSGTGSCSLPDGSEMTAVAPEGTLELDGLSARYGGLELLDRLGAADAPLTPTSNGVFVRVKLTLTNTLDGEVSFRNTQVALVLGPKAVLGPNAYAADTDPQALETIAASLRAGQTAEGAVTFDVPKTLVRRYLRTFAGLRVVTFGENMVSHSRTGLIRLTPPGG